MADDPIYHDGMRQLQDARYTRRIADRLAQMTWHSTFSDNDRAFIAGSAMVFVATADERGQPECSYKGGLPGFIRVLDTAPHVKDIVASNYAHLSATANGRTVAVMCVVDNLNKGAAGSAVQWMNQLVGLPETAGLTAPAAGWT